MALHTRIREEEQQYLAIPTGIQGSSFALTKITGKKNEPGYLVGPKSFREWRFSGLTRVRGEAFLYGPVVEGPSLGEVVSLPVAQALPMLARLAGALALLIERGVEPFRFESEGVLFPDEEHVLFLPPGLMALMKDSRPLDYRLEAYEAINHPYMAGREALSYTMAVLAYRVLTGQFPFMDDSEQGLRDRVRRLRVTPPHLAAPGVAEEASEMIMKGLGKPGDMDLEIWAETVREWAAAPPKREVSDEERQQIEARATEFREKAQRGFRSGVYLEKNGRRLLIVAAAVIVAGVVVGSILKNALAPRVTKGFTPAQVVEAFYTSIGKLDHQTMEDCVIGNAGKAEINEAVNLYVISRQTLAYEGKTYVIDAADWVANGRPKVIAPEFVHGVANLQITREQPEPKPVFLVKYERYARAFPDQDVESVNPVNGRQITDRVYMTQDKGDWVIYRIERLRETPLENP